MDGRTRKPTAISAWRCVYENARANEDADPENLIKNDIKESLHQSLLSVAYKLLSNQHLMLEQLSEEEQDLWNSYDNTDL
jgi:hypothetical protein